MNTGSAVAIIGLECKFPGVNNANELWKCLIDPSSSTKHERHSSLNGVEDRVGGDFDSSTDDDSSSKEGIQETVRPERSQQQHLFLDLSVKALENIKIPSLDKSKTGIWFGKDYCENVQNGLKVPAGGSDDFDWQTSLSAEASKLSVVVAETCSSSAVAVHLACFSLLRAECNLALAGGVSTLKTTRNGSCDNGPAPSHEEYGVLVLKTLKKALADGDEILATICGSEILKHPDTFSSSESSPFAETELKSALRKALNNAPFSPAQVNFLETNHNTDAILMGALKAVYLEHPRPLIIGSLSAAWTLSAAGIITTLLCMKHGTLPGQQLTCLAEPGAEPVVETGTVPWEAGNESVCGAVSCLNPKTGSLVHFILKKGCAQLIEADEAEEGVSKEYIELMFGRKFQSSVQTGIAFLESAFSVEAGFQTKISRCADMSEPFFLPRWERFTSLVALDLLADTSIGSRTLEALKSFLEPIEHGRTFNYFLDGNVSLLPDDVDDTGLSGVILHTHRMISDEYLNHLAQSVISNTMSDGRIQTYLPPRHDKRENRLCGTSIANAMRLVYYVGLDHLAAPTEAYLYKILVNETYLTDMESWYGPPDSFLYFLSKSVAYSKRATAKFGPVLTEQLVRRLGSSKSPLAAALRILAAESLGLLSSSELKKRIAMDRSTLLTCQQSDGSYASEMFIHMHRLNIYQGSEVVTTLFAARALHVTQ